MGSHALMEEGHKLLHLFLDVKVKKRNVDG